MDIPNKGNDKLTEHALTVLNKRYFLRDDNDNIIEDWDGLCWRVANHIAADEKEGDGCTALETQAKWAQEYYDIINNLYFLPNSPTFTGSGKKDGGLAACFVIPVEDNMESILDAGKTAALIHRGGGGTGFDFSKIRPANSRVKTTNGVASGPITFMKMYNDITECIKQGGCFIGDTLIGTPSGPIKIKDIKDGQIVYSYDIVNKTVVVARTTGSWITKKQTEVWELVTDKGLVVYATPDHPILCRDNKYVKLKDLSKGQRLMPLSRYISAGEVRVSLQNGFDVRVNEHQLVGKFLYGDISGKHIHHKDGNHLYNDENNLELLTPSKHAMKHAKFGVPFYTDGCIGEDNGMHRTGKFWTESSLEQLAKYRYKIGKKGREDNPMHSKEVATRQYITRYSDTVKLEAKRGQIVAVACKLLNQDKLIDQNSWPNSVKHLYNTQRYKVSTILGVFGSWDNFLERVNTRNHRVVSVLFSHYEDVYNMEVPGTHCYAVVDSNNRGIFVSNTRRGANMGTLRCDHPSILEFINCKQNTSKITNFNISVVITDKFMEAYYADEKYDLINPHDGLIVGSLKARDVFNQICQNAWNTGEPGLFFVDEANRLNRWTVIEATNPCLVGDTLIAVAEGRGGVSIKDLAKEGKDVKVYCKNDDGKIVIKWMRNPRITGHGEKIYKVVLDDGNSVRCTGNHKFILNNGEIKEAKDLCRNDSLMVMNRLCAPLEHFFIKSNSKSSDYWWVQGVGKSFKAEHRMIYEFVNDVKIPKGFVIHHKDFDSLNNDIDNLVLMTQRAHTAYHSKKMIGDNNPMRRAKHEWSSEKLQLYSENMSLSTTGDKNGKYSGITNEMVKEHAILLTKMLKRRASQDDWRQYCKNNDLGIQQFSRWRKSNLFGGIIPLLKWAAEASGYGEYKDVAPRVVKTYYKLLETGVDAYIVNDKVCVVKQCELCNKDFTVPHGKREISFCSQSCGNKNYYVKNGPDNERIKQIRLSFLARHLISRDKQIVIYNDLKNKSLRPPLRKEFEKYCKENGVSFRFGKVFKTFQELQNVANLANHRVVSVELDGFEDVYNGTVDGYHNIFVGGFKSLLDNRYNVESYVLTRQCGEQPLPSNTVCTLGSLNLNKYVNDKNSVDYELLRKHIHIATRFLDSVVSVNHYPLEIIRETNSETRRIGLGVMGFADMLALLNIPYGSDESLKIANDVYGFIFDEAKKYSAKLGKEKGLCKASKELGLPYRNYCVTTCAPTGTLSIIAGASSGIEPYYSIMFESNRMDGTKMIFSNPIFEKAIINAGVELTDKLKKKILSSRSIQHIKEIPQEIRDIFVTAADVTMEQHVTMQATFQRHSDSGISKTIGMVESATVDMVKEAYLLAHKLKCKGVTVYRDGSRPNQVLSVKSEETPKRNIRQRPNILSGETHKVPTALGKAYITINCSKEDGKPREVLINIGNAGEDAPSLIEGTAKLLSLCLKYDIPVIQIAKKLKGMRGEEPFIYNKKKYYSIMDFIGQTLQNHIPDIGEMVHHSPKSLQRCPECDGNLQMLEGCLKCMCGWSKC